MRPLTDAALWTRGSGLEIVLIVTGTILLTRLATWLGDADPLSHRFATLAGPPGLSGGEPAGDGADDSVAAGGQAAGQEP
jgi:hypothetical protein